MWIRSQNKTLLIEVTGMWVESFNTQIKEFGKTYHIRVINASTKEAIIVAGYSTFHKALKVLDMMQEHLSNNQTCVFEMPQDDEVRTEAPKKIKREKVR